LIETKRLVMNNYSEGRLIGEYFKAEQQRLLCYMRENEAPQVCWPDGCYGSGLPWLTFVGPSPGGGNGRQPEVARSLMANRPLWNEDYTDPCQLWSPGFRTSIRMLIEIILGRSSEFGALRLYNFLNFDWMQNPKASEVPRERMRRGAEVVLDHLESSRPRTVVTLESSSHSLLKEMLSRKYQLRPAEFGDVSILSYKTHAHRAMDAFEVLGDTGLGGSFVLRCPQHPARIFRQDYAGRVGRALRHTLVSLAEAQRPISIYEQ